ncbi:Protein-L-isoaspartate O-methyltransferase [Roseimaritima multifibrata]|uniref:Protein-L-isoaspartate O-methyltransferase n=1 Tax=Roseimaritima multifibrata TaxID=1930274 RepID=A0A517MMX8_9BACT|nr:protein-L-isoaspartate(D-aspartate) O-methyltransferase [Roseimaritima multifibrata]QDS96243.1 Protein-L-isoaspartate O-methyltransferase [Roseimaritima multifibrata]
MSTRFGFSFHPALLAAVFSVGFLVPFIQVGTAVAEDPFQKARQQLVETRIQTAGVTDTRVLRSIAETPRHEFVPTSQRSKAYFDMALPIGDAQTISSPFIVALMTEALDPQPTDKVLEIGTGSGYQAAVLSPLVEHVYTIEIVRPLGKKAKEVLERLGYENVSARVGDGFLGWPEAAPFDKIIVTCSPESIPQPLVDQLREGGQMIIPVGERYQQTLYRMIKKDGKLERQPLRPTLFVPMTGEAEDGRQQKPDPSNPKVINGDFSQSGDSSIHIPGWYYGRQVHQVPAETDIVSGSSASTAGESDGSYIRFENETPGLDSHLLQGLAIDGREVTMARLSGRVRTRAVVGAEGSDRLPIVAITFYDELRRERGTFWLGPFRGTRGWKSESRLIRVPPQSREAILRIGLFGATGVADFDDIGFKKVD